MDRLSVIITLPYLASIGNLIDAFGGTMLDEMDNAHGAQDWDDLGCDIIGTNADGSIRVEVSAVPCEE